MGSMTGGIIVAVMFVIAFGVARSVVLYRAKREAERKRALAAIQRLGESLQPPSKNKNKRRRQQREKQARS